MIKVGCGTLEGSQLLALCFTQLVDELSVCYNLLLELVVQLEVLELAPEIKLRLQLESILPMVEHILGLHL